METLQCPACGTNNSWQASVCEQCGEDLSAIKNMIDTANRHYNEALTLAQAGRLDEATGQVEAALALSGFNANYHLLLGTIYAQKENWEEAIRAWERCLALNPDVEKAYRNIEKARDFQEEEEQERSKRPYLLTAILSGALAVLLLVVTVFFAVQSYRRGGRIVELTDVANAQANQSGIWKQKYEALNAKFPAEGLGGLMAQVTQLKNLSDQRAQSIDQMETRYKDMLEQRNQELQTRQAKVQELEGEITKLHETITQINPLRHTLTLKNKDVENQQTLIAQQSDQINADKDKIDQQTQQITQLQTDLEKSRQDLQNANQNIRGEFNQTVESLRNQIQQLRNEVAQKDRDLADLRYADTLVVDAVNALDKNDYSQAGTLMAQALNRSSGHTTAQYLQEKVQSILNDPVEMEIRKRQAETDASMRGLVRSQMVDQYLGHAKSFLDQGQFGQAIETAKSVLGFVPAGSDEAARCDALVQQAENSEAEVTRQISEARGYIEKQDFRKATVLLKDVLRRAPASKDADELLKKITSS